MRFRISNGYNFAVEFEADGDDFTRKFRRARMEFFAHECQRNPRSWGLLHVQCGPPARLEWMSPNYPDSNNPPLILRTDDRSLNLTDVWSRAVRAHSSGTAFIEGLLGLGEFVSGDAPPERNFSIVTSDDIAMETPK